MCTGFELCFAFWGLALFFLCLCSGNSLPSLNMEAVNERSSKSPLFQPHAFPWLEVKHFGSWRMQDPAL